MGGVVGWFVDPYTSEFMQRALVVAVLVGVVTPVVGVWVVLRRVGYLGDAMSHGTLAGVALAYVIGVDLTIGALAAGVTMGLAVTALESRPRIAQDSAIGIAETAFFALGVIIVSTSGRVGIDLGHFLFGQIVAVDRTDLVVNGALTALALVVVVAVFDDLRSVTFDPGHARQVGVSLTATRVVLMVLISISVVVSLRTVGLLMCVAMLIVPATTARLVTHRVETMTLVAVGSGLVSTTGGLTASYHLASPPGPTIALVAVAQFGLAYLATVPWRGLRPASEGAAATAPGPAPGVRPWGGRPSRRGARRRPSC